MTESLKNEKKRIAKEYVSYLIPTVIGMITYSLYCLADLVFVSLGVGSEGLAALNIALPAFTIYSCIALLIGVGASVTMNICKGEGKKQEVNQTFTIAVLMITAIGILLTIPSVLYIEDLSRLLGANEKIISLVVVYLLPVTYTILIYMYTGAFTVMVRADGNPKLVMIAGVTGNILNIILDYIFAVPLNMGMFGIGLATVIGYSTSALLLMFHFILRKNTVHLTKDFREYRLMKRILKNGIGASIAEASVGFSIYQINLALMDFSGVMAVSIFNVISNIAFIAKGLFGGIAQAGQPLISLNYGLRKLENVKLVKKYAMWTACIVGSVSFIVLSFYGESLIRSLVSEQPDAIKQGGMAIFLYYSGCGIMGMNTVLMYYFQSIESAKCAILLAFTRGIGLVVLLLHSLPLVMGEVGIWLVTPIAEIITFIIFMNINKYKVMPYLKGMMKLKQS